MKTMTPEISWHSCTALYSVDFCSIIPSNIETNGRSYFMMATGSVDSLIGIWLISSNPTKGKNSLIFLSYLEKHVGAVNVVRFSPCGKYLATGGDDGNIHIWGINQDIKLNTDKMESMKKYLEIWKHMFYLRGHVDSIYDIAWSTDSLMLCSGSLDNACIVWSIEKRKYIHMFSDNPSYVQGVAWSPTKISYKKNSMSNMILCHCGDGSAKMYAIATKKVAYRIPRAVNLTLISNSVTTSTSDQNTEKKTGKRKSNYTPIYLDDAHGSFYRRCSFSPDGRYFILTSGIISLNTKTYIDELKNCNKPVRVAYLYSTLLPSTPLIYYSSSCNTSCISVKFSPKFYKLRENVKRLNPSTTHLKYRMLFALLSLDTLTIYDTQSLDPIGFIKNTHLSAHSDVSWFPDGNGLVFASTDGYCTICEFSPLELGSEIDKKAIKDNTINKKEEKTIDKSLLQNNTHVATKNSEEKIDESEFKENNNTTDRVDGTESFVMFHPSKVNVKIADSCPEDISNKGPIGVSAILGQNKPKRVSFVTISKPSSSEN